MSVERSRIPLEKCERVFGETERDRFARFAQTYPDETLIQIPFNSLYVTDTDLADDLRDNPAVILDRLKDGLREAELPVRPDDDFADAEVGISQVKPDLSVDQLRRDHIGAYIGVRGRVSELTQIKPDVKQAAFECQECSNTTTVEPIGDEVTAPDKCEYCDEWTVFELCEREFVGDDRQLIELSTLHEEGGEDSATTLRVEVENDLAGAVRPGDTIRCNGTLKFETQEVEPNTSIDRWQDVYLDCRAIDSEQTTFDDFETTRVEEIEELSKRDGLFDVLIRSFAPHILTGEYGDMQKLGMVLQQFGGVTRELPNGTEKRSDINILLVGDPGTAKSQYLHSADHLAPKSMKASGKGATAAGLTATAEQSELTGSWTLKAGALVLANNGIACVDEFDKMDDSARKSMHEALEDQQIPINKAGINTTLPAKCAVLAAANPEFGRYDRTIPMQDQIDLDPPLIQRFDLIFGLMDEPDDEIDRQVVKHQLAFGEAEQTPEVPTDLLREYIAYARQKVTPSWDGGGVKEKVADFYLKLRNDSASDRGAIGPRVNDAIRRLAEASARARLSETVEAADIERATELMSFHVGQVAMTDVGDISVEHFDGMASKQEQKDKEEERFDQLKPKILNALGQDPLFAEEVAREVGVGEEEVRAMLDRLSTQGHVIERNGKWEKP